MQVNRIVVYSSVVLVSVPVPVIIDIALAFAAVAFVVALTWFGFWVRGFFGLRIGWW